MKLLASIVVERGLCVTMHRVRVSSVTDKPEQHGIILSLPELAIRGQQWSQNDFILHKSIGKSRFGSVHLATNRRSGEQVALKILDKNKLTEQRRTWLEEELYLLQKLCHENIIKIRGWFEDGPSLFIMLEYAECLDVSQYVRSGRFRAMKVPDAIGVTRQILNALFHLHERGILHRNIVASTVLLKPILDAAHNQTMKHVASDRRRTLRTLAESLPLERLCFSDICRGHLGALEKQMKAFLQKASYFNQKIDSWYVGVLMFHMVTGYLPSVLPMAHRLSDQLAAAAPGEYVQLAISLANEKPLERPNISDALQECTRVLKVICPQETRIEKALKPTGTTPKESQKIMRKPEKLSKPPESSSKVLEASLPEKSTKVSEPFAVQLMDLTKMPEAPSKKAVLAIKPFKKLSETVETTTIKPESIKQAEDNIMDQPQNVISMYHESMKRSKGPIKQFEKPPKPLKSPSKESTKPLESPTKEVMKPSESLARKSQRPAIELQRFSKLLKSTTLKSETFSKLADNFTKSQGITKSMDSSRGKSQTSTKSIDSPTGKSQGHIKLTDSLTGKSQMAAPEPEHMKHSKGVSKRHETLGVHPISNAKQPGLFSKEPQSLVNVSENGKKLLVLTKKPESSKKQPKVLEKPCQRPKRRLQSTVQSMKSVITKPLKQVCSITSNGNSQNLMNIIEHFRKQSPNLTSRSERLKKKSRDRSRDSAKLSESSSEMSPKAMGPSDRLAKTGNRRKVKSHRKALSPQKQVQPAPRKSQNFAELTDRPSRFSKPARKLQSFKKIRRRSKQSERSIKKSPSPVKFGVARKLTARIGKPEAQNEKSPAAIKKTDIRVGKVQYLSKAVKNSVIKSQSFAKKSTSLKLQDFTRASSPSAKSRDFIRRPGNLFIKSRNFARRAAHSAMKSRVSSRKPEITSIKPQNFAKSSEKKNMKSEGLTTFAETPSRSNNSKRLTEIPIGQSPSLSKLTTNRNGKCANLMTTPQNSTKCSENFVGFSVDAGKQSEYTLKEGKCSIPKQGEKFARQPERVSKEAEEISKSEQD